MPQRCTICDHPELQAINVALINGVSSRLIASRWNVGYKSVQRHKVHIPAKVIAAGAREQVAIAVRMGKTTIDHLDDLITKVDVMVSQCETDQDRKNFIAGIRELRECRTLAARLSGELSPNQTNIQVNAISMRDSPEWPVFIRIIERHPEIRAELNEALLEGGL